MSARTARAKHQRQANQTQHNQSRTPYSTPRDARCSEARRALSNAKIGARRREPCGELGVGAALTLAQPVEGERGAARPARDRRRAILRQQDDELGDRVDAKRAHQFGVFVAVTDVDGQELPLREFAREGGGPL